MMREVDARSSVRRYRIVAGIDLTEYAEIVLEHALDQAARHPAPELHFVFVRERRDRRRSVEELSQRLAAIAFPALQTFNRHGKHWRARLHVRAGKPDEQIAALAQDLLADLIVVGQFGLHNPRPSHKTVASSVLLAAPCATLVVGMPPVHQAPMCLACARVREDTEGARWFCNDHVARDGVDQAVSPVTEWTEGAVTW